MLRVKFSKNEPNTVPVVDIGSGGIFKVQHGQTAYMVVILTNGMKLPNRKIAAISLDSGRVHMFSYNYPVVELDGTLELSKVVIKRES